MECCLNLWGKPKNKTPDGAAAQRCGGGGGVALQKKGTRTMGQNGF
jgi:hypothetical protein